MLVPSGRDQLKLSLNVLHIGIPIVV
jgi:hypothetical protein